MKHLLYLLVISLSVVLMIGCQSAKTTEWTLAPKAYQEKLGATPKKILLDVRTPEEFAKSHLANAINVNWHDDDFEKKIDSLDKNLPVFLYCLSGPRSSAAAEMLQLKGFKVVYDMEGGLLKWRKEQLPEVGTNEAVVTNNGLTKDAFEKMIQTAGKPFVLIDFYADWCGPCKIMKPDIEALAKTRKQDLVVITINADDNPMLLENLGVDALPTLFLYKQGKLQWQNVGLISQKEITAQMQ
ncbi:MAG: thioredoxin domain-containing protein [Chitinophagaceae bacterium]